jgi:pyridoxamine 5'-phosphate oxidase
MSAINKKLVDLRTEYRTNDTSSLNFSENPIVQFEKWMDDAINSGAAIPNAMHLSTIGNDGRPSGRIVLLHGLDERGFIFYTNYESRKGQDLKHCNFASLTFFWSELFRQVRIEGEVSMLPDSESERYFRSRPRESQLSTLASEQSRILDSRGSLENKIRILDEKYKGQPVPRPSEWGGYFLTPVRIEFWQGRPHRLHDRILYQLCDNKWKIQRLYP